MNNQPDNETPEEKAKRLGVRFIPPLPEKEDKGPNDTVAICGQCGREVKKVEHYSCQKGNCPIQIKPSFQLNIKNNTGDINIS